MLSYFGWGSKSPSESSSSSKTEPEPPQTEPSSHQQPQQNQTKSQFPQRPLKLLLAGTTFLTLSLLLTRRALRKRHLSTLPPYYTSAPYHRPDVNGALDAFEAFNLATLNVVSFGMVGGGAVMWKLGVNDLEDARGIVRRVYEDVDAGMGKGGGGWKEEDEVAEREVEKWVIETLGLRGYEEKKREILEEREGRAGEK